MSPKIYFVADLHLEREDFKKKDLFLAFVKMVKSRGGDLYILGDLFDYWANNRRVMQDSQTIFDALSELTRDGAKVGFLIGNRDLLLREKVLSRYGIDFLGESKRIVLQGKSLLLTHGHLLYTNDVEFQNYRKTKWPIYRALDAFLPGFIENALAERFILKSKQVISAKESWRLQFSEEAIEENFSQGIEALICGHSHHAVIKRYDDNKYFIVLPCWDDGRGGYLLMEDGNFQIKDFPED